MITAIAIDDEPPALKVLEHFCSRTDFIDLRSTFTKPAAAARYMEQNPVSLLFLDIQMPSVSGLDFLRAAPENTMAIFTTAHSTYAVEGFELNAIDYLLKPFTFDRFMQAVNKAGNHYTAYLKTTPYIYIRADYNQIRISLSDIQYIESYDDYVKIYLQGQKPILTRITMKSMLEKLPEKEFLRIHRSFIIACSKIEVIRPRSVVIAGNEIPVSTSFEAQFRQLKHHTGGHL